MANNTDTKSTTNTLYARTNANASGTSAEMFTPIAMANLIGTPHLYRIEWNVGSVVYYTSRLR